MTRVNLPLLGVAAVLLAASAAFGQAPQPADAASGGPANPALLEMLRLRLEEGANLHPADGVRLEEARFVRGAFRVRGTVASQEQAEAVRREIESLRPRLERAVEAPISSFDLSALRVAERIKAEPRSGTNEPPVAGQAGKSGQSAGGQAGKGQSQAECTDCVEEYPAVVAPPPPAKGHTSHWKKKSAKGAEGPYSPYKYLEEGIWLDDGPNAFMDLNCQPPKKKHGWGHKGQSGQQAPPHAPPYPWMGDGVYYPY
jgi:hypothetical protein